MKPIESTVEILAFKALNRNIDVTWVTWAVDMLIAGFDNMDLAILAGENEPYNQFQLQSLTNKILDELHLDYSDKERTIKNYVCYLIDKALNNEIDSFKVLGILRDICIELDYEKYLYDFYSLYYAKEDLLDSDDQWYWEGADKNNIDSIIIDSFKKWKVNY